MSKKNKKKKTSMKIFLWNAYLKKKNSGFICNKKKKIAKLGIMLIKVKKNKSDILCLSFSKKKKKKLLFRRWTSVATLEFPHLSSTLLTPSKSTSLYRNQ